MVAPSFPLLFSPAAASSFSSYNSISSVNQLPSAPPAPKRKLSTQSAAATITASTLNSVSSVNELPPEPKKKRQTHKPVQAAQSGNAGSGNQRSYRGITKHKWNGRYDVHLWDKNYVHPDRARKGKKVYVGHFEDEKAAVRASDLAAIKYWESKAVLNLPILAELQTQPLLQQMDLLPAWPACSSVESTEEQAADAYDRTEAVINFDVNNYVMPPMIPTSEHLSIMQPQPHLQILPELQTQSQPQQDLQLAWPALTSMESAQGSLPQVRLMEEISPEIGSLLRNEDISWTPDLVTCLNHHTSAENKGTY